IVFCPILSLFFLLAHHDPQPAERLEDARGPAAAARSEPLHRDRLADRGLGDDERVDVEIVVVLGVGDRAGEHLTSIDSHRLLREGEDVQSLFSLLAADQAGNEVQLLRRPTDRGADRERLVLTYAAGSLLLAHQRLPLLSAACPGKLRVGANSPSLWPTMSSLTDTGMNFCPLYTLNVRPTNCGRIVLRRDQVLIGARPPLSCASSAFFSRDSSTNGPFQTERAIIAYLFFFAWRERMIILSVCLLLRVRAPLVGLPHGVTG